MTKNNLSVGDKVIAGKYRFDDNGPTGILTVTEVKDTSEIEGTTGQWVKTDGDDGWVDKAWFKKVDTPSPQAPQPVELREKLKRIHTLADNYPLTALLDSEDFDAIIRVVEQYGREQRIDEQKIVRNWPLPDSYSETALEQMSDARIAELQAARPQAERTPDEQ